MWETMGSVLLRSAQSESPPPKGGEGGPSSSQEREKKKVVIYDVATIYGRRKGVGWTYGRGFWTPRRFVVGTPG